MNTPSDNAGVSGIDENMLKRAHAISTDDDRSAIVRNGVVVHVNHDTGDVHRVTSISSDDTVPMGWDKIEGDDE
jgi:hypothetical protein